MSISENQPPGIGGKATLGMPLLVFSAVLTKLLLLSWFFLLPHFTRFDVAGAKLSAFDLVTHKGELEADIREAEAKRDRLLLPTQDPLYGALKAERFGRLTIERLRSELLALATKAAEAPDVIALGVIDVDLRTGAVRITGDVQNVGPRSMTVLAQFVETLKASPFISGLTPPAFAREQDAKKNVHSPFTIEFIFDATPSAS